MIGDDTDEYSNTTETTTDPYEKVIETILFGDLKEAANQLRSVQTHGARQAEVDRKVQDELAASQKHLEAFNRENPGIANDKLLVAAVREKLIDEERDDLARVGVDLAKIETDIGRKLTGEEVASAHLHWRVAGSEVRRVPELLEMATDTVSKRFNLIRRQIDPGQAIRARQTAARKARGLTPLEYGDRSSDSDSHVGTTVSASDYTKSLMGYDEEGSSVESSGVTEQQANRISAAEKMKMDRLAARGRKVGLFGDK
jgi:hypothetical protein